MKAKLIMQHKAEKAEELIKAHTFDKVKERSEENSKLFLDYYKIEHAQTLKNDELMKIHEKSQLLDDENFSNSFTRKR